MEGEIIGVKIREWGDGEVVAGFGSASFGEH
jgi:hypothetical protein